MPFALHTKTFAITRWMSFVLIVAACTGDVVSFPEQGTGGASGGDPSPGGGSAGGSGGGQQVGGNAGSGGESNGNGGAGGSWCDVDCSSIVTPQCYVAVCNDGMYPGPVGVCTVVPAPNGAACEDGAFCTSEDSCVAGRCVGGPMNDCDVTPPACQIVVCVESSQSCATVPGPNGVACTSTDLCAVNTFCSNGSCIGQPKDCFGTPLPNECHVAACNPQNGMCESQPGNNGDPCTDPPLCTVNKTCSGGACQGGAPLDCSGLDQDCLEGVCDPNNGQCTQVSVAPGQACTGAADDCNLGICDANAVCQAIPTNEGGVCDDGSSCTSGTTCASGVCQGGSSNITVFFGEDFASNAAGWTLDGEWQIGSALASMGGTGNPDPGQDHTPTADNGVAGVVIGGNAATNMHPYHYLTSPPFNASGQPVVFLQFERWLNSDYTPYMQNRVEVFDGSTWVTIWESGPQPPIFDNAWMPQTFDVSAHANANMRVRFGFTIGQAGVYTVSQWNVDDILLADGTCP